MLAGSPPTRMFWSRTSGLGEWRRSDSATPVCAPSSLALVYCSVTGFGSGVGAALPGYDLLAHALGGLMSITGQPRSIELTRNPIRPSATPAIHRMAPPRMPSP